MAGLGGFSLLLYCVLPTLQLENLQPLDGVPSVHHLSGLSSQINPMCFHLSAAVDDSSAWQKYQENMKKIRSELRSVEFTRLSAKYSLKVKIVQASLHSFIFFFF